MSSEREVIQNHSTLRSTKRVSEEFLLLMFFSFNAHTFTHKQKEKKREREIDTYTEYVVFTLPSLIMSCIQIHIHTIETSKRAMNLVEQTRMHLRSHA